MKKLIIFCLMFAAPLLSASDKPILESMTCQAHDGYAVDLWFNSIGGKGTGPMQFPMFTVRQNGEVVGNPFNSLTLLAEEHNTSYNVYLWAFGSDTAVIYITLPLDGSYDDASARLHIGLGEHVIDSASAPCTVVLR